MADFRSPFVPELPRFTGRRGRLSRLRRRVLVRADAWRSRLLPRLGRRCRVHAVRHGARLRSRAASDPDHRQRPHHPGRGPGIALSVCVREDPVSRARARAQPLTHAARRVRGARLYLQSHPGAVRGAGARGERAHRRRRHLSGRAVAALRSRGSRRSRSPSIARCATSTRRPTCISSAWAAWSVVGSSPEMLVRVEGSRVEDAPDRRDAAAWPQRRRKTCGSPKS